MSPDRRELLERLARIQRSISHGVPLPEVLQSITSGAIELIQDDMAGLRLIDAADPSQMEIVASVGLTPEQEERLRQAPIGEGAGGRAIAEGRLVVVEDYETAAGVTVLQRDGLQAAMAAPVRDGDAIVGSLVVATYARGRTYSDSERDVLEAFAEHASLALTDARLIAERERLAASHGEQRLRALIERSTDLILVVDAAGAVRYQSPSVERTLGFAPDELGGRAITDIVHADDRERAAVAIRVADRPGEPAEPAVWRLMTSDGGLRHVEVVATNLLAEPDVAGIIINGRDVTERLRAEEARRASERLYRLIVETTQEGIWLLDAEDRAILVNGALLRTLDLPEAEVLGRKPFEVLGPRSAEQSRAALERRHAGVAESYRFTLQRPDGTERELLVTATPILGADGRYDGALALFSDVTDLAAAQADREELERRLERANTVESLGRLAAQVAHDFRNVLVLVMGSARLAQRPGIDPAVLADHLARIIGAAEHGEGLTRQLVDFSRGEHLAPEELDLDELVVSTADLLQAGCPAGVTLRVEPGSGATVCVDSTQLRQIILNLVRNAVEALGEDGVGVVTIATAADAHEARLTVSDDGPGMAPEVAARATQPLFTTKRGSGGTGFGLAIVAANVDRAGGRLRLDSAPGAGTTVTVTLPAR